MTQRTRSSLRFIDAVHWLWRLVLLAACAGVALPASSQARFPSRDDGLALYRAFYYKLDASNKPMLTHIEIVRDITGRTINALPKGFAVPQPPERPPSETTAVIGEEAVFAIYYGIDFAKERPRIGRPKIGEDKMMAMPLAIEWLSDGDTRRVIEAAQAPPDACQYPRMCHCGFVGTCCCY